MALSNLPRTTVEKLDGFTGQEPIARAPRALVIGTAGQGVGHEPYYVTTTGLAKSEFGNDGTLIRGMWEVTKSGAEEVVLYRIGCTSAILDHVGDSAGAGGYTITTVMEDTSAGASYSMYYVDSTNRLVIRRNSDDLVVYDNDSTNPIDEYEVTVSGSRAVGGGPDIGSASSFVDLEDVDPSTYAGISYTAGNDGLGLSRMEIYEQLYVAYKDLLSINFDVLVPMDVYLDDYNIVDQGHYLGAVTPVLPAANTYPTAGAYTLGSDVDSLGSVYVEEYEGQYYFWWRTSTGAFTAAQIYPTNVGSASATLKIDGTALSAADFHEVNFAYQMGRFLYDYSMDIVDASGVIGCLEPASTGIVDRARWLGKSPTWTLDSTTGEYAIASASDNGSGLLGNKFMVGQYAHRSGTYGGGFILTDTEFMDGEEQVDDNDAYVDLGKYIDVVADTVLLRNSWLPSGYLASFAPSYGGFYIGLAPQSAPTNKKITNTATVVYRQALGKLDDLAGAGYVTLRRKEGGVVIADAPAATLPNSDWKRRSTNRIVKAIVDAIRRVAEPYLGEGFGPGAKASLKEKIEQVLLKAKQDRYLVSYKPFELVQTPSMAVAGRADLSLTLQPAFELRHLAVTVALAKSI